MKKVPGKDLGQAMPKITKDDSTEPEEYETKGHISDLMRAHEIMNDPIKMKAVHALAGRHKKAISSIQDLKDTYQAKFGPKANKKSNNLTSLQNSDQGDADEDDSY